MPLEGVSGASDMGGVECQGECSNLGMFGVLSATSTESYTSTCYWHYCRY